MRRLLFALLGLALTAGHVQGAVAQVKGRADVQAAEAYYALDESVTGHVRIRAHTLPDEKHSQVVVVYLYTTEYGEVAHTLFWGDPETETYQAVEPVNANIWLSKDRNGKPRLMVGGEPIEAGFLARAMRNESTLKYQTTKCGIQLGQVATPEHLRVRTPILPADHDPAGDVVGGEVRVRTYVLPDEKQSQLVMVYLLNARDGEMVHTLFLGDPETATYESVEPTHPGISLRRTQDGTQSLQLRVCGAVVTVDILLDDMASGSTGDHATGVPAKKCSNWGKDGTPEHPDGWPGKPGRPGSGNGNGGPGGDGYGGGNGGPGGPGYAGGGHGGNGGDGGPEGGSGGNGGPGGSTGGDGGHGGNAGSGGGNGGDGGDGGGNGGDGGHGGAGSIGGSGGNGGTGGNGGSGASNQGGNGGGGGGGGHDGGTGGNGGDGGNATGDGEGGNGGPGGNGGTGDGNGGDGGNAGNGGPSGGNGGNGGGGGTGGGSEGDGGDGGNGGSPGGSGGPGGGGNPAGNSGSPG